MSPVRVLLVDDFDVWKNFVITHLDDQPNLYIAGFASNGEEALQKAEELQPDLILLDVNIPKLSGIDAARQIRKLAPKSRILFLSCDSDPDVVRAALCAGGQGYILKRDATGALLAGIEAVLHNKQYLSASLGNLDDLMDTAT